MTGHWELTGVKVIAIASYAEFADNVIVKCGIEIWYFKAVALQQRETETSFAFITYVGLLIRYF